MMFSEMFSVLFSVVLFSAINIIECRPKTASEEIAEANDNVDFKKIRFDNSLFKGDAGSLATARFAETDELLTEEQVASDGQIDGSSSSPTRRRRALLQKKLNRTWEDNTVPYVLDPVLSFTHSRFIQHIMRIIEWKSCVRFEQHFYPHLPTKPYVIITPNMTGCWSTVGMNRINIISLQAPICFKRGIILHELLHSLGFRHEQSRADRDKFIKVNWDNIRKDKLNDFEKRSDTESLGENYDIKSVMHYHSTAFSKNKKPTLESLDPNNTEMGGDCMTTSDVRQLRLLYNCPNRGRRYGYRNS